MTLTSAFYTILRMNLTGSAVILAVLFLRFCLRKAPKIYSYLLWAAVLFRLLCPFTVPVGVFSPAAGPLQPMRPTPPRIRIRSRRRRTTRRSLLIPSRSSRRIPMRTG